jgi:hypothetical protein
MVMLTQHVHYVEQLASLFTNEIFSFYLTWFILIANVYLVSLCGLQVQFEPQENIAFKVKLCMEELVLSAESMGTVGRGCNYN